MTETAHESGVVDAVHLTAKGPRFRTQTGRLVEYSDGYYLRFYDWDEADNPGAGAFKRKKVSRFLCPLETEKCDLKHLQRDYMKKVNARQKGQHILPDRDDLTVEQFWITQHWPMIEKNKSWSTARTYKRIWAMYLQPHFARKVLVRYVTVDGNRFLTELAQRKLSSGEFGLNRNSLNLVRALCTGIFSHAQNQGMIDRNPFSDVKLMVKIRKPKKTVMYSLAEVAAVLAAIPRTDAKLLFSFCALLGLRPSEAAAVRWSDVNGNLLSILRAAPAGHLGETKTERSVGSVLIIKPVARLIESWRTECSKTEGFMFKRRNSESVIDVSDFARQQIVAYARKAIGSRWHGLYAGRRAVGSALYNLTGDTRATFGQLRNTKGVTDAHYVEASAEPAHAGSVLLDL
jgi:integrase